MIARIALLSDSLKTDEPNGAFNLIKVHQDVSWYEQYIFTQSSCTGRDRPIAFIFYSIWTCDNYIIASKYTMVEPMISSYNNRMIKQYIYAIMHEWPHLDTKMHFHCLTTKIAEYGIPCWGKHSSLRNSRLYIRFFEKQYVIHSVLWWQRLAVFRCHLNRCKHCIH